MSFKSVFVFLCSYIWYYKCKTLPKLYFQLSKKRNIPVNEFRDYERAINSFAKLQLDIQYFKDCEFLEILPKFLRVKTPKLKVYDAIHSDIRTTVLRKQVALLSKELHTKRIILQSKKKKFQQTLSCLEYYSLISKVNAYVVKASQTTNKHHQIKLMTLWKSQRRSTPNCLINISHRILTIKEEEALRYGLKHHILPRSVNDISVKTAIEKQIYYLKKDITLLPNSLIEAIKHSTLKFLNAAKQLCRKKTNVELHKILLDLKNDNCIKLCKFDKGNGVLIINDYDYYAKLDDLILNTKKFTEITISDSKIHPIISKENSIVRFFNKKCKPYMQLDTFSNLVPSGSQPGKIYGLAKVHKEGAPLRPVVSMIKTAEYNLAKYLVKIINDVMPTTYMLSSTRSFVNQISSFDFLPSHVLVSYDVVSLFTNIPLNETIDIVCNYVYQQHSPPKYSKETFKKLLQIATGGYFIHRGKLYCQIDVVTMESPLGPTLANFFLAHLENQFMGQQDVFMPVHYSRYVDDIFCVFNSLEYVKMFLSFLNNIHPNLKFTCEIGPQKLAFLDTQISLSSNNDLTLITSVYRKPTDTKTIINFHAVCPWIWKSGLIKCFLNRAFIVCNNWFTFDEEMSKLKDICHMNGYPKDIFYNHVRKFLSNKLMSTNSCQDKNDEKKYTVIIPFIGHPSITFNKSLAKKI